MLRVALVASAAHSAASLARGAVSRSAVQSRAAIGMSLYDFSATKIDGSACSMTEFKDKPVLILNVASL
jgi:hypothetical protein